MLKVRITATRQTIYNDLIAQYENPIEHACDIRQGQQWISVNGACPDGLCPSAWESMRPFVESLAHGKGNFFDGWMKNPMSAMISCNDGFRPFSFYIEAVEEESQAAHEQSDNQPELGTEKTCSQPTPRLIPKDKEEARVYKLVQVLGKQVLPRRQIIADLGMRQQSRHTFINNYLRPTWERGLIEFVYTTVPHKPEQSYRLTSKGLELWAELTENTTPNIQKSLDIPENQDIQ
jgi:uncharacterized repeat protein (TIGR04076 family)